jgi:hypothetical protein
LRQSADKSASQQHHGFDEEGNNRNGASIMQRALSPLLGSFY